MLYKGEHPRKQSEIPGEHPKNCAWQSSSIASPHCKKRRLLLEAFAWAATILRGGGTGLRCIALSPAF